MHTAQLTDRIAALNVALGELAAKTKQVNEQTASIEAVRNALASTDGS